VYADFACSRPVLGYLITVAQKSVLHYRIEKKLGEGGMGEVFLATDTRLDRKVAIKFLSSDKAADPESRQRFIHEAKAEAMLSHPNIVTFHEVGEAEGQAFIVMEHIEGRTLPELVRAEQLSLPQILDIVIQVSEGLQAAHEKGVVHRDIKPENIMVTPRGHVKIADFGLARWKGATTITKSGTRMGTAYYMSPEQVEGRKIDHRSDIFSLGVVLYELICKQRPFEGATEAVVLYEVLNSQPAPLARFCRDMPDEIERIVTKCIAKNPGERYQSASDLVADLRHLRRELESGSGSGASRVTQAGRPAPAGRKSVMISAAALAAAIVVLLVAKPWRVVVEPTQEAEAVENRLAVMYFDNMVDPDDAGRLGEIVSSLLITDLSESEYVSVVSNQRLYDILKNMGREGQKRIDREVASQVAERARARWMLMGDILQVEPELIVSARLVEVSSGSVLSSAWAVGEPGEKVFTLVDKLTAGIKMDLALPAAAKGEPSKAVTELTTNSTEAYRYYLEGLDYIQKYMFPQAAESLRKAVKLDSSFAVAWYRLAAYSYGTEAQEALKKAVKYSDRASTIDRLYILAAEAASEGRHDIAFRYYEDILRKYPDEKRAHYNRANVAFRQLQDLKQAAFHYLRAVEIDSLHKDSYNHLAYVYAMLGDPARSEWAINKYLELAPDEPNPYDSRGELFAWQGELDSAKAYFDRALSINPDFIMALQHNVSLCVARGQYADAERYRQRIEALPMVAARAMARRLRAYPLIRQGRFDEALEVLAEGITADGRDGADSIHIYNKIADRAFIYEYHLHDQHRALAEYKKVFAHSARLDPGANFWESVPGQIARVYARSGDWPEAEQWLQRLDSTCEKVAPLAIGRTWWWHGCIEAIRRDFDSAVVYFEMLDSQFPSFMTKYELARALFNAGEVGKALPVFERALQCYDQERALQPGRSVVLHYDAGLAYETAGDLDKAMKQYETFLDIWKNADPGIPEMADARRRLAKLREL